MQRGTMSRPSSERRARRCARAHLPLCTCASTESAIDDLPVAPGDEIYTSCESSHSFRITRCIATAKAIFNRARIYMEGAATFDSVTGQWHPDRQPYPEKFQTKVPRRGGFPFFGVKVACASFFFLRIWILLANSVQCGQRSFEIRMNEMREITHSNLTRIFNIFRRGLLCFWFLYCHLYDKHTHAHKHKRKYKYKDSY